MPTSHSLQELHVAPRLMLMTVKQLTRENAELFEEVKQLRAAVNVYRELAMRKGPAAESGSCLGSVKTGRDEMEEPCQHCIAEVLP
jgi:hypothetical protein